MNSFQKIGYKLRHLSKRELWLLLYLPIHLIWYLILEQVYSGNDYHVMHSPLDDMIPFCEWFVFPYLIWFLYMAITGIYLLVNDEEGFERYILTLWVGFFLSMTFISFFPTQQNLRPEIMPRENFASWIMSLIYAFDTNTNVFPSMHVVGALAVEAGIAQSKVLKPKCGVQIFSAVLCLLIIIATVFLKQHSVLDVFGGIGFFLAAFIIVSLYYKLRNRKKRGA